MMEFYRPGKKTSPNWVLCNFSIFQSRIGFPLELKTAVSQIAPWVHLHDGMGTTGRTSAAWILRGGADTEVPGQRVLTTVISGCRSMLAAKRWCTEWRPREGKIWDSGWRPTESCLVGMAFAGDGTECGEELWWVFVRKEKGIFPRTPSPFTASSIDKPYTFFFQLLTGNRDRNTIVRHRFARPRRARYVRVVPYTWHRHISMRVELYGRRLGKSSFILLSRQARIRLPLYIC